MPVIPARTQHRLQAVVLLAAVVMCGACSHRTTPHPSSGGSSKAAAAAAMPTVPPAAAHARFPSGLRDGIELAIDQYAPDAAQTAYLMWSAEVATSDCVRGLGFDVPQPRVPTSAEMGTTHDRRYGVVSTQDAAVFGYHLRNQIPGPTADPYRAVPDAVLNGGSGTFNGHSTPAGGCRGQTSRTFNAAKLVAGAEVVSGIDANSYAVSLDDADVRQLFDRWEQCMTQSGYHYVSPLQAIDDADLGTAAASPAEIATASADVACKISTNLITQWASVESGIERPLIAADLAHLQAYKRTVSTALTIGQQLTSVEAPS